MSYDGVPFTTETCFSPIVVNETPYDERDPISSPWGGEPWSSEIGSRFLGSAASWRAVLGSGPDTPRLHEFIVVLLNTYLGDVGSVKGTALSRFESLRAENITVGHWLDDHESVLEKWSGAWKRARAFRRSEKTERIAVEGLETHLAEGLEARRVIADAAVELRRRFPGRLELRVERIEYNDGGGPVGGELFFVIGTELDGAAAHDKLEAFMDEFWLDRMQAHPNLPIPTIELL